MNPQEQLLAATRDLIRLFEHNTPVGIDAYLATSDTLSTTGSLDETFVTALERVLDAGLTVKPEVTQEQAAALETSLRRATLACLRRQLVYTKTHIRYIDMLIKNGRKATMVKQLREAAR